MNTDTNAYPLEAGIDELEQMALAECIKRLRIEQYVSVLIMPAFRGNLAVEFAKVGAQVTLADAAAQQSTVEGRVLANGLRDQIHFAPYDLPDLPQSDIGEPYDIIIFRRSLCALPYPLACQVLRELMKKLRIGGKLYLSVLGLHSVLGENYPHAEEAIGDRYCELDPAIVEKYRVEGPVCLYTERNLFMLLLEAGASVLRTFTTTYGNVKAVAVRV